MTFRPTEETSLDTLRGDVRPQPRKTAVIGGRRVILLDSWLPVGVNEDGSFFPLRTEQQKPCFGHANGCVCGCKPRRRSVPRQPWQTEAA